MQKVTRTGSGALLIPLMFSFLVVACSSEQELNDVTAKFAATGTGLQISGYAATGAPVPAGSTVEVHCVNGHSNTATSADGSFAILANDLAFPCLLRTTWGSGASQQTLHSIATAVGVTQITPLTQVIVAQAAGGELDALFTSPTSAGLQAVVTQLPALQTKLRQLLTEKGMGVALAAVPDDFFTGPLKPAMTGAAGNAHDSLLDALKVQIGNTQALGTVFAGSFKVDLGIAARVDWSKCAEAPRYIGNGQYYAGGCATKAVALTSDPQPYIDRAHITPGEIDMALSSPYSDISGGKCSLNLRVAYYGPDAADLPGWLNGRPAYFLTSWYASVFRPDGLLNILAPGTSGGMGYPGRGEVVANGPESGASVVSISSSGGRGELIFENTYLRRATMSTGECLWPL